MSHARDAVLVVGFVLSVVGVLVTPFCTRDRVADPTPWVSLVREQASAFPAGTLLLVHPPWRDDVVDAVRAAHVLPAGVSVTSTIAPRHGEPLPPLVILREAGGVWLPKNLRTAMRTHESAGLELLSLAPTAGAGVARELTDELGLARVRVTLPDRVVECAWDGVAQRHVCPDLPEWMHVGAESLPVGGKSERCAWAHPITGGTVSVVFPASLARSPLSLALALTDTAADNRGGAAVTAVLFADERELGRVTRQGARGFGRTLIGANADDAQELRVEITTPHDGQRHTCFRLTSGAVP